MSLFWMILFGLLFIISILAVQLSILLKIKKMVRSLNQVSGIKQNPYSTCQNINLNDYKHTCQNCKYRLSYIHIGEPGHEDFYYRCKLQDIEVTLKDTCKNFKEDS